MNIYAKALLKSAAVFVSIVLFFVFICSNPLYGFILLGVIASLALFIAIFVLILNET